MSFIGHLLTQENISGVLTEIPPLISESDLHISQVRTSKKNKRSIKNTSGLWRTSQRDLSANMKREAKDSTQWMEVIRVI